MQKIVTPITSVVTGILTIAAIKTSVSNSPVVVPKKPEGEWFTNHENKKSLHTKVYRHFLIAGAGFEPTTFGL